MLRFHLLLSFLTKRGGSSYRPPPCRHRPPGRSSPGPGITLPARVQPPRPGGGSRPAPRTAGLPPLPPLPGGPRSSAEQRPARRLLRRVVPTLVYLFFCSPSLFFSFFPPSFFPFFPPSFFPFFPRLFLSFFPPSLSFLFFFPSFFSFLILFCKGNVLPWNNYQLQTAL